MKQWLQIRANRRALAYILFSAAVLGTMIAAGILPAQQQIAETQEKARHLEAEIETQQIFHPLYQDLKKQARDTRLPPAVTGTAAKSKARVPGIDNASRVFESMARSAGMKNPVFSPEPGSMKGNDDSLMISGRFEGDYADLRNFLIRILMAPEFERIQWLKAKSGTQYPEYRMGFWISIQ